MRENCLDIGTIQAFLDGELASDLLETAARHIALCDVCASHLATAEEESAIAFTALEQEFNTLVPTQRLWTKINDSIERERKLFWQTIFALFKNPTVTAFASLLIVFGLFIGFLNLKEEDKFVARQDDQTITAPIPVSSGMGETTLPGNAYDKDIDKTKNPSIKSKDGYQIVKTDFKNDAVKQQPVVKNSNGANTNSFPGKPAVYQYLPGEESYIETISTLEKSVETRKDEVLNSSSRFSFEQDMALVNDAIKRMRAEVKKNPKNEAAKQVLLASYQNKVDLLNSVAEKTELMASMR